MSWQQRLIELTDLVPPPDAPYGGPVDWNAFEAENGFIPPEDYRALLDAYGPGTVDAGAGRLSLLQPMHPGRSFLAGNRWLRDTLRGLQRRFSEQVPSWPIYPDWGGFLPFAVDDTSWTIGWLTRGVADEWLVAIDAGRDGWWREFSFGAVEFVARWIEGGLEIPEIEPSTAGGTFLPLERDEHWSAATETARVVLGPGGDSDALAERPIDWVRARISPARLRSFGASGDAGTPIHGEVSVAYEPAEEARVIEAMRALAAELGTRVVAAYALDESQIWSGLVAEA